MRAFPEPATSQQMQHTKPREIRSNRDIQYLRMSKIEKALIKCDDGICSLVAWWETPQHGRSTELDYLVEPQADRTEVAQTGPLELTAPMYIAPMHGAERSAPLQGTAEAVSRALACLTARLL